MPGGPCAAQALPILPCAICCTRGMGSNVIVNIPDLSQPLGLFPCSFFGPVAGWARVGAGSTATHGKQCYFHHQRGTSGSMCGDQHQILCLDQKLQGLPAPSRPLHWLCLPELCCSFSRTKQGGHRLPGHSHQGDKDPVLHFQAE